MMKKTIIISVLAATAFAAQAQDLSNSIEYGQLYIVGDATESSWDLGKAPEFNRIADGVFEWTGRLKGDSEFKFMNTREAWHKHIVAAEASTTVEKAGTYPLAFYADWGLDGSKDLKFKVAETGEYTVTVDLTTMRMSVSDPVETAEWSGTFYLIGTATGGKAIEIPAAGDVEHKATIRLTPGFVKLMDTPEETESTRYFEPRFEEVDISYGEGSEIRLYPADKSSRGWSVGVAGDYSFYLDNARETMKCRKYRPYKVLYLTGGCCELAWNYWSENACRLTPDPSDPDLMVWEGELRYGWDSTTDSKGNVKLPDEPSKFKILTAQDWFRDTYHPYVADCPAEGESAARISGGDDVKWTISRNGWYRIELNTRTETLRAECLIPDSAEENVEKREAGIHDTENAATVTGYYSLEGMRIERPEKGIYIETTSGGARKRAR